MFNLTLSLLGLPRLERDGVPIKIRRRKAMALLAYLAVAGPSESHSRDTLAALFWPESDQIRARSTLRGTLSSLNKALDGEGLAIDREYVALEPSESLWVDVHQFRVLLTAWQAHGHPEADVCLDCLSALSEAVELYRGDFLAGFTLRDSPQFDDWQSFETERLRQELEGALERLVRGHSAHGDYRSAIGYAQRWSSLDPLREAAHRALIELHAWSGDRSAALRQYEACARVLKEEMGVEPSPETTELYQQVYAGELRAAVAERRERVIRGYEIRARVGEGNFGVVYRAYQPRVGREVAVKAILPQYANHPDFIRRFEAEAQVIARLEHPYIVPLYDYWREPDGAYLVMRWLRGGSLGAALERGPWKAEAAAQLVDQIAAALAVAHRQGVVHRDIKPANILLDEQGNAYLSDFGIAKDLLRTADLTQTDAITGSPAYISPEQIQEEPVTPLTDIYSLGVVLYELLTGAHPFPDESLATLLVKHLNEPLPLVVPLRPDLSPTVDKVIQQATAKDPTQRFPDALTLADAFRQALTAERDVVLTAVEIPLAEPTNPYKGLRPFYEADAVDFFGREALTERLLVRLAPSPSEGEGWGGGRFLAVVGPSGSGKSSVVRAGLVPALRRGALPGSENWFVVEMLPGAHPLEELEIGLLRVAIKPPTGLMEQLQRDERGILRAARLALPEEGELLLIIDQFEELFTLVEDRAEAWHFLDSLHAAVSDPRSPLRVVITLRADFFDRPLSHPSFSSLLQSRTEVVVPLTLEELGQAIRGPVERVGVTLEEGLVTAMVAQVNEQPGGLPLLQYALTELFERRDDRLITLEAYHAVGGVLGALGRRAEALYAELDADGQEAARQLFLRLVILREGIEDVRRRVLRAELKALTKDDRRTPHALDGADNSSFVLRPSSAMDQVIETFGKARLLTFDRDPVTRGPTVEVAHEALLREWRRLREWLDKYRADVRTQRLLVNAASEWAEAGRDESFLLRGSRLDQFEGWVAETELALTEDERAFLEASSAERRRREEEQRAQQARELALERSNVRRLRVIAGVLLAASVLGIILTLAVFRQSRATQAEANSRATAEAVAVQERQVAESEADSRATAEAVAVEQREDARRQASIGLSSQALLELEGSLPERAVLLALEAMENYPYTWQAERALGQAVLGNRVRLIFPHEAAVNSARWSSDGTRVLSASSDGTAKVWSATTGEALVTLLGHEGLVQSAAWSPSGERILTDSWDGTARVWDAISGEELLTLSHQVTIGAAIQGGQFAAWSPTGERIFTADTDGFLIWDAATGEELFRLSGHTDLVTDAAWSPDGSRIATASSDGTVKVWLVTSSSAGDLSVSSPTYGEELFTLSGHTDWVVRAAWSPDGARIATVSWDGTARVWDARTGAELLTLSRHEDQIRAVAWSPAGDRIVTGGGDAAAKVWDAATGEELFTLSGHLNEVRDVVWSADGSRVVTASEDGTARIWDVRDAGAESIDATTGTEILTLFGHTGEVFKVAWSPAGDRILTAGLDGTARVWDLDPTLLKLAGLENLMPCPAWSPRGDRISAGFSDGRAKVWDAVTGEELLVLAGHTGPVCPAVWSPSGDRLLTASLDPERNIKVWDAASGQERLTLSGHSGGVWWAAWSPDGQRIVTAGYSDETAKVWDADTGAELLTFTGHTNGVTGATWSPDGKSIATSSWDGTTKIWDPATGEVIRALYPEGLEFAVTFVDWSPDGARIATYGQDGVGRIWDATSGEELLTFSGHTGDVWSLFWSATGERIVTGSQDGTLRVWDAATGVELLRDEFEDLPFAIWAPDGKRLATASFSGTLKVYPAWQTTQELLDYARECCVVRQLTAEERELFGLPPR